MLKLQYVGRGMHLEFRHPHYATPIVTSAIQEIRDQVRERVRENARENVRENRDQARMPALELDPRNHGAHS